MQERSTDALEMLLPEAAPAFWQRAQRVTTFLRLLADDSRSHGGSSVAVSLPRARSEFERSTLARRVKIHEELLRHHLYALVGADSFAHFGECEGELQLAWSELEEERAESSTLAHVPFPGESVEAIARRLLDGLERAGASTARVDLWRARSTRAAEGPEAGEAAFERWRTRNSGGRGERGESGLRNACLAGLVECLLDRAAVRTARVRLEAEGPRVLADARLRRLFSWTRALCGDGAGARSLQNPALSSRTRLPRPLAELRARVPALAPWFSGPAAGGEPLAPACEPEASGDLAAAAAAARTHLGATLFSAWVLEAPGRARPVAHALAPAHGGRWCAWLESREGACADPREAESQLLGDARTRVAHFGALAGGGQAAHAIDPSSILATLLVPVSNAGGDVCGWLNLQFEHHLIPSSARLERLARSWTARLAPRAAPRIATIPAEVADETSFAAEVLRGFVDGLALKTAQRRWSAFDVRDSGVMLVAAGGGALESAEEDSALPREPVQASSSPPRSPGRAVARAISAGRTVLFGESDRNLALHPAAMSGVAVPLMLRGRVAGVWLIESTRRRDFSSADVQRFEARADGLAAELAAAQFRAWHVARFGHDVHVSSSHSLVGLLPAQLVALANSRSPIALHGPIGSGRRMLARRLHFEGPNHAGALRRIGADPRELERAFRDREEAEGWIVDRILDQPHESQVRIAQLIEERADTAGRVYLILDRSLAAAAEQGRLAPELAWLFSRVELRLAALAQRRHEIAPIAQLYARHFATELGVRMPQLDDTALAFLWRQSWGGNVRELAQWMYRLVMCHFDGAVDARALEALAQRFGHGTLRRIPSRHPDREVLVAALESTATGKGSWNKTRAALYLGWDTDTLQSRIADAGLTPGSVAAPLGEAADASAPAGDGPKDEVNA